LRSGEVKLIVGVIGAGYVGLPLTKAAISAGHLLKVFDIDSERIQRLRHGESPVEGIDSLFLKEAISNGKLSFSDSSDCLSECDVVVICVPTPLGENQEPDLTLLKSAAESAAQNMPDGSLLINESTSFPGTLREIIVPIFKRLRPTNQFFFASSPERVDPGNSNWNIENTPRLISGLSELDTKRAKDFYSSFCKTVHTVSSPEVAEFAKLAENTFRQVNIALVNEYAEMCTVFGINPQEVLDAAATKPFGFTRFRSGIGVGGHCIPIDPMYLLQKSKELGYFPRLINEAQNVNRQRTVSIANRIKSELKGKNDPSILVYGLAYKSGVSDLRESPSIELINLLRREGYLVSWYDEKVERWIGEDRTSLESKSSYDLLAVVHFESMESVDALIGRSELVFDATGKIQTSTKVRII